MAYRSGCHTTFHHRDHLVWASKYRFKVLIGDVRLRVREIIRQVCDEMGVTIVNGALSKDHVHMFIEIPPHVSVADFVRRAKPVLSLSKGAFVTQNPAGVRAHPQTLLGPALLATRDFSTTSGNIIMRYLDRHTHKDGFSPST
ncbi:MAG: IS200/IS605 family transposase [Novosphingobium sp.]